MLDYYKYHTLHPFCTIWAWLKYTVAVDANKTVEYEVEKRSFQGERITKVLFYGNILITILGILSESLGWVSQK